MDIAAVNTPIGRLGLVEEDGWITRLLWQAEDEGVRTDLLCDASRQLEEYFLHERAQFDLPLAPAGTAFQKQVYAAMLDIPSGQTRTYGDIAKELGVAAQPVGQACGSNPIPVIIPCHRVVGADGLGGFSAKDGVEMKVKLLQHEGAYSLLI